MRLISSPRATFFYQKVAPAMSSLMVVVAMCFLGFEWAFSKSPELFKTAFGVFLAICVCFQARAFRVKLADEVWLDGETLIVKQKGESVQIEGEMLGWVDHAGAMTASLVFKCMTPFGMKIVFIPATGNSGGSQDGIVEELQKIQRRHR